MGGLLCVIGIRDPLGAEPIWQATRLTVDKSGRRALQMARIPLIPCDIPYRRVVAFLDRRRFWTPGRDSSNAIWLMARSSFSVFSTFRLASMAFVNALYCCLESETVTVF